jgi:diguanylate cyclase (GGDEF)-like protein/PAS domain S-box-containing protein
VTATDPVPDTNPVPRMVLWPLVIVAVLLAVAGIWYARLPDMNIKGSARLAIVIGPGVAALLWSLVAYALAFRPAFPQVPARWWLISLAGLSQAVGFAIFAFRDQTPNIRLPGPAAEAVSLSMQLCFLAVQPLLVLGLAAFPSTELGRLARRRYLFDATIVALAGALVLWAVASQRATLVGSDRPSALQVAYAVGDLLVLFTLATHLFRLSPKLSLWQGLALLTVGAGLLLLTNSWVPNQPGAASLRGALPHERTFYAELLFVAGLVWLWAFAGAQGPPSTTERRATGVGLVSFGALAAGYVLLAVVASRSESRLVIGLTIGAAVLTAVVVARQIVTVRENLDHEAQRTRRSVEERFESLVANASEAIVVVDRDGTVLYASPSVQRLLGLLPEEVIGRPFDQLLHPEESVSARTFLHELLARPWGGTVRSWRLRRADGGFAWGETTATNLLADPNVRGIVLNTRDITERRELEQRLTHQAMHDGLTGLANRVLLRSRLEQALRRPRPGTLPPALLFLDLDGFKGVNDTFGHAQGDALLIAAATRLREQVGSSDVVARLGGDEFAVLLEAPRDRQAVLDIAHRITSALKVPFRVFGRETAGSASIGVAIAEPVDSAGDVLRHADVAMYLAKANGRGRYELFEPRMLESVVGRLGLQSDLRRALDTPDSREFLLDYQPIVELATQRVVGVEALMRWDHPVQGRITPAVFVPLAEETGLIVPLGRRALHLACSDSAPWVREYPGMHVTVNLSARQLPDPALASEVSNALAESGLPPASLVLELTESAIMQQPERSAQVFRELRGLGVRLAIDDFGTGYSSLSYLQKLPAAILKIDRSFLTSLDQGPNGSTLVKGIIGLANGLGLITVAEGIENEEQATILRALGCSCGQGLLFSPPLPASQVGSWLEDAAVISASGGARALGR